MKKQIFYLLVLASITVSATAQSVTNNTALAVVNKNAIKEVLYNNTSVSVNTEMAKRFEKNYPHARNAQWEKVDEGFRVSFVNENSNTIAVFQGNGKFEYSITDVTVDQLPVVLRQIIHKDYKNTSVLQSVAINNKGNVMHQVILESSTQYSVLKVMGEDVEVSSIQNASAVK